MIKLCEEFHPTKSEPFQVNAPLPQSNNNTSIKFCNYNRVKELVCKQYLLTGQRQLSSTRWIAEHLNIAKSSVARIVLMLEDEGILHKESVGNSPRNSKYIIVSSFEDCSDWYNEYFLSSKSKRDRRKIMKLVGQFG